MHLCITFGQQVIPDSTYILVSRPIKCIAVFWRPNGKWIIKPGSLNSLGLRPIKGMFIIDIVLALTAL